MFPFRLHLAFLGSLCLFLLSSCANTAPIPWSWEHKIKLDDHTWTAPDGKVMPYTRWPKMDEGVRGRGGEGVKGEKQNLVSKNDNPPKSGHPPTPAKPKAIIIAVHGLSGAASDFWPLGERAQTEGYVVYAYEVRGQGHDTDPDSQGNIRNRSQWVEDLVDFTRAIRQRHPGIPVYWYGESLGSLIILETSLDHPFTMFGVKGVILATPVVGLRPKISMFRKFALHTAMRLMPWFRIPLEKLGGVKGEDLRVTRDTTHGSQMKKTAHYVPAFTLRTFHEIGIMIEHAPKAAAHWSRPLLVLYTPNDILTTQEQVETFYQDVRVKDKTKHFHAKSYHLLLHDVERKQVLDEIMAWLKAKG